MGNPFLDTLRGEAVPVIPFWFMRQAGRYLPEYRELRAKAGSFLELCYTPELAAEVTLQPLRRFDMDAAILFSDILVIPQALGMDLRFVEGEGPKLAPLREAKDVEALTMERLQERLAPIYQTIRNVRAQLAGDKALIGFSGSPWTLMCYMIEGGGSRDFDKARQFAYAQPKAMHALTAVLIDAVVAYVRAQIDAGAQAIQLFDSWAGVTTPELFAKYVVAPTRAIVAQVKQAHPTVPVIGFPRGAGMRYAEYAQSTGVDAVSLDYTVPLDWARDEVQPHAVLQGNLDPLLLAADGDLAIAQARRIIEAFGDKAFVFNLGHGMVPHIPIPHVEKLCAWLKAQRRQ